MSFKFEVEAPSIFQQLEEHQQGGWVIRVSCAASVLAHPRLDPMLPGRLYWRVLRRVGARAVLGVLFLLFLFYFALRPCSAFAVHRR